jgi:energy-coupling factor transporter ATP-binding protein EcfA2
MRLNRLWVDKYKNLKDCEILFDSEDSIIALVGNNGTGKSNLIEVLLEIFIGLFYDDLPTFNFELEYEAHGKHIKITSNQNIFRIEVDEYELSRSRFKKWIRYPQQMPPFPAMIFSYYSGTCDRVAKQLKRYRRTYASKLKTQSTDLERQMIFSDIVQAEYVLVGLFAHNHDALLEDLSVEGIYHLTITVQSPVDYRPDVDDPMFWGLEGSFRDFLAKIQNSSSNIVPQSRPRTDMEGNTIAEERIYKLDSDELRALGNALTRQGTNVYSMFQALSTKKILVDVDCTFVHNDRNSKVTFDELSEGEKQLISVIGGLWLSNQHECLVLLDEPDTHLNPNWSARYTQLITDALNQEQRVNSTVLMATHDPMLIADLSNKQVLIAENNEHRLSYSYPYNSPQGLGITGILTSEMFGLMTTLDHKTSGIISNRRTILEKPKLNDGDMEELQVLNEQLDSLGYNFVHPDEDYRQFLIARKYALTRMKRENISTVEQRLEIINNILVEKGYST